MKKISNIISKHDNIFMLGILFLMTISCIFSIELDANDELWNFSNIYKMTNGYQIYKDLNVIITPLFFYIGEILLRIFGTNYLNFRIYEIVFTYMLLFFTMYNLFKKLKIRKLNSFLYTILIASVYIFTMNDGSYNIMSVAIIMVGIIIQIYTKKKNVTSYIIQGIIIFLVFMTKQNIGVYYILGIILYNILNNKNTKNTLKELIIQFSTAGILLITFLIYLYINGNLYSFINYTILGIGEFANNNISYNGLGILVMIFEVIVAIILIILTYIKKVKFMQNQKENIRIVASLSIFTNLITYPLLNMPHILIASLIFYVLIIYFIDTTILKEILIGKKIDFTKKIINALIIIIFLSINIYYTSIIINDKNTYFFPKESIYYGGFVSNETKNEICEICNYIITENKNGYDVKIISYYSNLYMNILKKNNGDMDLPFYGNLGKDGEEGMINKISKLKKTKLLVLTQEDDIYQESKKVISYIKENLYKEATINKFSIYNID